MLNALVSLLLLASIGLADARAKEPIAVIPYRIDYEGALTVSVTIDGRGPYDFILDTGATLTLAFQNLADRENFAPTGGPRRRVLGISGVAEFDPYRFGAVGLGPAMMPDHVGVILPDWAAPRKTPAGVLGLDFLESYALVFDVGEQTITLYEHGSIPKSTLARWRTVTLEANSYLDASDALYTTTGYLNRSPTTFIIDLGSAGTLINYRAAEALLSGVYTFGSGEGFSTGSRIKDVFDDRTRARTAIIDRVRADRTTWRKVRVWVHDAPIFTEIGVQRRPFGLLGADLLAAQDFALDFGEERLYLSRPPRHRKTNP